MKLKFVKFFAVASVEKYSHDNDGGGGGEEKSRDILQTCEASSLSKK
jgi:hypothetical protein